MRATHALVVVGLVAGVLTVRPAAQQASSERFAAGEILVKFTPGANANDQAQGHQSAGATLLGEVTRTRVQRVRVPAGAEDAAIAQYRRNPNVLYAERNVIRHIPMPSAHGGGAVVVPSDSYFDEQWALHNTGQLFYCISWTSGEWCLSAGTPDADIDAPEAWDVLEGNSSVTVAVIDSGVDYNHPDLAPNYAGGYDFFSNDSDPMDDHGHGTHVAGTIAAALGNHTGEPAQAEGVVGVAPNARIRAYKVCGSDGTCTDFAIQQAIAQAIDDGATVINMSLGESAYSASLDEAVQDAWNAGLVIVAGAGNNGTTDLFYPAALDNVISVGSFDAHHRRSSFSNYGTWVDISAPGDVIMSSYPMVNCAGTTPSPGDTGCYTWNSGTSMATPHVAGAAALVWSRGDVTSNTQVVDILLNSADGDGMADLRLDSWTIHGGLNLHDAVSFGLANLPPDAEAGPDQTVADSDGDGSEPVNLDGSASSDQDGTITGYTWREGNTTIATDATATVTLSIGLHTLTLEVTDDDGDTSTDTVIVTVNPANQVTVTASTAQATEAGPTNGVFTVTRAGGTSAPLTVLYTVAGTAATGSDYTSLSGSVTIAEGASSGTIVVTPIDDSTFESNETVILTLIVDVAYSLGSPTVGTVTIVSDDLPPDLVVSAMTAPTVAGADTDIVVTNTTKNQGTGGSLQSQTGFYLSTNTSWDASDILLGTRPVSALAPGATDVVSTTLHIPPSAATGAYRILAKADWNGAITEKVETNNVSASGVVNVGPDLTVSAVSGPTTASAGATISVTNTTKNQGGSAAAASTTRFYWSTNTTVDATDEVLGSRPVPLLTPGATDSSTTALTVPATASVGTYYVIAQSDADGALAEAVENNNHKATAAIKVGADLIVTGLTVPANAAAGATISVTETTKNQGAGDAAESATGFYLSTDNALSANDDFLGSRPVGELAPNGTSTLVTTLQIPGNKLPGSYYVIVTADWNNVVAETSETNNKASKVIRIGGDLVVTALSAPTAAAANSVITLTDTVKNQGLATVAASVTGFYLSTNATFDESDRFLGNRAVGSLAPSATDSASTQVTIPPETPAGGYYLLAVADVNNTVVESLENNNTKYFNFLRIGPDLIVTAVTAPTSAAAGTSITAGDTTKNQGAEAAPASVTSFYLSTNSGLDGSDVLLGQRPVSLLGPGLSETGSVSLAIPADKPAGNYFIIAKSDGADAVLEGAENNNTRLKAITITAPPQP